MKSRIVLALLAAALASSAAAQDPSADPNYGSLPLSHGFPDDPQVVTLRAGGELDARELGAGCSGFITSPPDVRLIYEASTLPLILSVAADADTTLVVNDPNGRWYCDDDGGVNGSNPMVRFNTPPSGRYEIWVGTYRSGVSQPARLHVSEISSQ